MFNKKPKRNFRKRNTSSSDDGEQKNIENGEDETVVVVNKPSKVAQSRGISCNSKREATPPKADSSDGEDVETSVTEEREETVKANDVWLKKANTVFSFSDDKEGIVNVNTVFDS